MNHEPSLYLASPFGFSEGGRLALAELIEQIRETGWHVVDPWELSADFPERAAQGADLERASQTVYYDGLVADVGRRNEEAIRSVDLVLAVLDGSDVDSGVAAEVGFAYATGKRLLGYRGDFRAAGEAPGIVVNLQVQHFIRAAGGQIVRSFDEVVEALRTTRAKV